MKLTVATAIVVMICSLLLLFAANCSLKEQAISGPAEQQGEDQLIADNSSCYVCHLNYEGEELALDHEVAGVGCKQCHGPSYDHCNDESNLTPPDVMYPEAKINPHCMTCHPKDDIVYVSGHKHIFRKDVTPQPVCTHCHGEHRLKIRSVRWDKVTGQLLPDEDDG
jgi:hypothetical protein